MNSICIFAHFNKNNDLEEYVIDYLKTIKSLVDEVIFISTSDLKTTKINFLKEIVQEIIIRQNEGYDFGSWKEGLLFIKNNYKNLPKEIILCNDSCYISKVLLKKAISEMRKNKKIDFWGITKNYMFGMHLQSYFIVLNSKPLSDKKLWEFLFSFKKQVNKVDYIIKYEIGLSKFLKKENYVMGSYINFNLIKHSIITTKYKLIFIKKYLLNLLKYLLAKSLFKSKSDKNLENIKKIKSNLFLKKTDLSRIYKIICIFTNPLSGDITQLSIEDLMKINSPFLKVTKVKELIKKESINKFKIFCNKKKFNYKNIVSHQLKINKFQTKIK